VREIPGPWLASIYSFSSRRLMPFIPGVVKTLFFLSYYYQKFAI
jgi:hypothetical protein